MIVITIEPPLNELAAKISFDIHGSVQSGVYFLAEAIREKAQAEAPVRTSNLVNSIVPPSFSDGGMVATIKATAPYALFVHRGTGIYGPYATPIVPVNKKALFWPGAAHPVRSVKGMKPNPFFTRAIEKTNVQAVFEAAVQKYLTSKGDS